MIQADILEGSLILVVLIVINLVREKHLYERITDRNFHQEHTAPVRPGVLKRVIVLRQSDIFFYTLAPTGSPERRPSQAKCICTTSRGYIDTQTGVHTETKGYRRHRGTPTNAAKLITFRLKRFLGTLLLIPFGGSKGLFPYRTGGGE